LSRHDLVAWPAKRRPRYLFPMALAGVFMCAGLLGTYLPASADTFSHLPTIDLYPTVNYATGNDEYGSPGGPDPNNNYGPPFGNILSPSAGNTAGGTRPGKLDLNAVISIPIIKNLAFQYEHDRAAGIDTTIGRTTNKAGVYQYHATSNDIADTFRLSYTGIKGVGVTLATFYRFRHDNPATNDVASNGGSPSDWHQQTLTLSYTAPPIAALNGTTIGFSGTLVHNKHHASANYLAGLAADCAAAGGPATGTCFTDSDGKTRTGVNYGPNINVPINHGFALFGSAAYGGFDYFDNTPAVFYYDIIDVGIYKKFNQVLSLTADLNNLTQIHLEGSPFVPPNTIHRIYFAIALDIHLAPSGGKY
jgi:hypothetical protein